MTFSELIDVFRLKFGEIVPRSVPEPYVKHLINQGAVDIARKTRVLESVYTTNSVADQATYGLSSEFNVGGITLVAYDGTELTPVSQMVLDTSTGTPDRYYMMEGTLGLYPIPNDVKEIKIRMYEIPDAMTSSSEISPIPVEYHDLMIDYALWQAIQTRDPQMAEVYHGQYRAGIDELLLAVTHKQEHRLPFVQNLIGKVFN